MSMIPWPRVASSSTKGPRLVKMLSRYFLQEFSSHHDTGVLLTYQRLREPPTPLEPLATNGDATSAMMKLFCDARLCRRSKSRLSWIWRSRQCIDGAEMVSCIRWLLCFGWLISMYPASLPPFSSPKHRYINYNMGFRSIFSRSTLLDGRVTKAGIDCQTIKRDANPTKEEPYSRCIELHHI